MPLPPVNVTNEMLKKPTLIRYKSDQHSGHIPPLVQRCQTPARPECQPVNLARSIYLTEKQIIRSSHPSTSHLGFRLVGVPHYGNIHYVGGYALTLENHGLQAGPSVSAYLDLLLLQKEGLTDPGALTMLILGNIRTEANKWALTSEQPITIATYVSHAAFGSELERAGYELAADNIHLDTCPLPVRIYTQTYDPLGSLQKPPSSANG